MLDEIGYFGFSWWCFGCVVFQPCDVQVCAVYGYCGVLGCSPVLEIIPPVLTVCVCVGWDMFGLLWWWSPRTLSKRNGESERDGNWTLVGILWDTKYRGPEKHLGRRPLRTQAISWLASSENDGHGRQCLWGGPSLRWTPALFWSLGCSWLKVENGEVEEKQVLSWSFWKEMG
jgi:hypothetical protein